MNDANAVFRAMELRAPPPNDDENDSDGAFIRCC